MQLWGEPSLPSGERASPATNGGTNLRIVVPNFRLRALPNSHTQLHTISVLLALVLHCIATRLYHPPMPPRLTLADACRVAPGLVLSFLPLNDVNSVRLTCSELRADVANNCLGELTTRITGSLTKWRACFPAAAFANVSRRPDITAATLATHFHGVRGGLRGLDVRGCADPTWAGALPSLSATLRDLRADGAGGLTDSNLLPLDGLTRLQLEGCSGALTDDIGFLPRLASLSLQKCSGITGALFARLPVGLHTLRIDKNAALTCFDPAHCTPGACVPAPDILPDVSTLTASGCSFHLQGCAVMILLRNLSRSIAAVNAAASSADMRADSAAAADTALAHAQTLSEFREFALPALQSLVQLHEHGDLPVDVLLLLDALCAAETPFYGIIARCVCRALALSAHRSPAQQLVGTALFGHVQRGRVLTILLTLIRSTSSIVPLPVPAADALDLLLSMSLADGGTEALVAAGCVPVLFSLTDALNGASAAAASALSHCPTIQLLGSLAIIEPAPFAASVGGAQSAAAMASLLTALRRRAQSDLRVLRDVSYAITALAPGMGRDRSPLCNDIVMQLTLALPASVADQFYAAAALGALSACLFTPGNVAAVTRNGGTTAILTLVKAHPRYHGVVTPAATILYHTFKIANSLEVAAVVQAFGFHTLLACLLVRGGTTGDEDGDLAMTEALVRALHRLAGRVTKPFTVAVCDQAAHCAPLLMQQLERFGHVPRVALGLLFLLRAVVGNAAVAAAVAGTHHFMVTELMSAGLVGSLTRALSRYGVSISAINCEIVALACEVAVDLAAYARVVVLGSGHTRQIVHAMLPALVGLLGEPALASSIPTARWALAALGGVLRLAVVERRGAAGGSREAGYVNLHVRFADGGGGGGAAAAAAASAAVDDAAIVVGADEDDHSASRSTREDARRNHNLPPLPPAAVPAVFALVAAHQQAQARKSAPFDPAATYPMLTAALWTLAAMAEYGTLTPTPASILASSAGTVGTYGLQQQKAGGGGGRGGGHTLAALARGSSSSGGSGREMEEGGDSTSASAAAASNSAVNGASGDSSDCVNPVALSIVRNGGAHTLAAWLEEHTSVLCDDDSTDAGVALSLPLVRALCGALFAVCGGGSGASSSASSDSARGVTNGSGGRGCTIDIASRLGAAGVPILLLQGVCGCPTLPADEGEMVGRAYGVIAELCRASPPHRVAAQVASSPGHLRIIVRSLVGLGRKSEDVAQQASAVVCGLAHASDVIAARLVEAGAPVALLGVLTEFGRGLAPSSVLLPATAALAHLSSLLSPSAASALNRFDGSGLTCLEGVLMTCFVEVGGGRVAHPSVATASTSTPLHLLRHTLTILAALPHPSAAGSEYERKRHSALQYVLELLRALTAVATPLPTSAFASASTPSPPPSGGYTLTLSAAVRAAVVAMDTAARASGESDSLAAVVARAYGHLVRGGDDPAAAVPVLLQAAGAAAAPPVERSGGALRYGGGVAAGQSPAFNTAGDSSLAASSLHALTTLSSTSRGFDAILRADPHFSAVVGCLCRFGESAAVLYATAPLLCDLLQKACHEQQQPGSAAANVARRSLSGRAAVAAAVAASARAAALSVLSRSGEIASSALTTVAAWWREGENGEGGPVEGGVGVALSAARLLVAVFEAQAWGDAVAATNSAAAASSAAPHSSSSPRPISDVPADASDTLFTVLAAHCSVLGGGDDENEGEGGSKASCGLTDSTAATAWFENTALLLRAITAVGGVRNSNSSSTAASPSPAIFPITTLLDVFGRTARQLPHPIMALLPPPTSATVVESILLPACLAIEVLAQSPISQCGLLIPTTTTPMLVVTRLTGLLAVFPASASLPAHTELQLRNCLALGRLLSGSSSEAVAAKSEFARCGGLIPLVSTLQHAVKASHHKLVMRACLLLQNACVGCDASLAALNPTTPPRASVVHRALVEALGAYSHVQASGGRGGEGISLRSAEGSTPSSSTTTSPIAASPDVVRQICATVFAVAANEGNAAELVKRGAVPALLTVLVALGACADDPTTPAKAVPHCRFAVDAAVHALHALLESGTAAAAQQLVSGSATSPPLLRLPSLPRYFTAAHLAGAVRVALDALDRQPVHSSISSSLMVAVLSVTGRLCLLPLTPTPFASASISATAPLDNSEEAATTAPAAAAASAFVLGGADGMHALLQRVAVGLEGECVARLRPASPAVQTAGGDGGAIAPNCPLLAACGAAAGAVCGSVGGPALLARNDHWTGVLLPLRAALAAVEAGAHGVAGGGKGVQADRKVAAAAAATVIAYRLLESRLAAVGMIL